MFRQRIATRTNTMLLRALASLLLLINGIGAIYGGWNLIAYPDGSGLGVPLSILLHSPFHDFLIPGTILFVVNGVGSLLVLVALLKQSKHFPIYLIGEGALLTGWIIIQVMMVRGVALLHIIFFSVGVALMLIGWRIRRIPPTAL